MKTLEKPQTWYKLDQLGRIVPVTVVEDLVNSVVVLDPAYGKTVVKKADWRRQIYYADKRELVSKKREEFQKDVENAKSGVAYHRREIRKDEAKLARAKKALADFNRKHRR